MITVTVTDYSSSTWIRASTIGKIGGYIDAIAKAGYSFTYKQVRDAIIFEHELGKEL
jgi:hypothetical protein